MTGGDFGCGVRRLSSLVFWVTARSWVLALRDGKLRLLYFLVVLSSIGCGFWRLGNGLILVCVDGSGWVCLVCLGSTSVTLVIGCSSRGMIEGDPASFQTWKIAPSIKPGSTDWTPIHGGKGHSSILGSLVTERHDSYQASSSTAHTCNRAPARRHRTDPAQVVRY